MGRAALTDGHPTAKQPDAESSGAGHGAVSGRAS